MLRPQRNFQILAIAASAALLLTACGGGDNAANPSTSPSTQQQPPEVGAPGMTGDIATDGFNWFNFRRQQLALPALPRNGLIDAAARGHSNYQVLNNTITHDQTTGNPGFTGKDIRERLAAAGYMLSPTSFAFGEVISKTSGLTGFDNADELIRAIYHRFVIFEPMFKEGGAGAATASNGATYFTTDFVANNGFGPGIGAGQIVGYPFDQQQRIATSFDHGTETPDPVPPSLYPQYQGMSVGYPVSVHANLTQRIDVASQNFTIMPIGSTTPLPALLLSYATDPGSASEPHPTPISAAAIIPLTPLAANTRYQVRFSGTICSADIDTNLCSSAPVALTRSWTFTTR
ncbi:CAP domain-containing protein [Undibacterium arcticum]